MDARHHGLEERRERAINNLDWWTPRAHAFDTDPFAMRLSKRAAHAKVRASNTTAGPRAPPVALWPELVTWSLRAQQGTGDAGSGKQCTDVFSTSLRLVREAGGVLESPVGARWLTEALKRGTSQPAPEPSPEGTKRSRADQAHSMQQGIPAWVGLQDVLNAKFPVSYFYHNPLVASYR